MPNFFDTIKNIVVKVLPPIVMPQKRYIILGITIIYLVAKQLVLLTPSTIDDQLLDQIHQVAMQIVQNAATPDINSIQAN